MGSDIRFPSDIYIVKILRIHILKWCEREIVMHGKFSQLHFLNILKEANCLLFQYRERRRETRKNDFR